MDIKTLLNNLHEEVSCSVCTTTFTDPKTLPCLHSFCLHCLKGIQRTSGSRDIILCPQCRRECRVSSGNLNDLPTNFRINSLLDVLAIQTCNTIGAKCGNCENRKAKCFYCFQCCAFWCEDCITAHNILRANKVHRVLALKDFQYEDLQEVLKRPAFCQKRHHEKKVLEFFCKDCEVAVCSSCVPTLHNGHTLVELEEAAHERKEEINSLIESLKQNALEKTTKLTELDKKCNEIRAKAAAIHSQVQTFCNNMIELIEAKKYDILTKVEYQTKEFLVHLERQMTEIGGKARMIEASAEETRSLLERSTDAEVVHLNTTLDQLKVDKAEDLEDYNLTAIPDFKFVENQKLLDVVNTSEIGLFVVKYKKTEAHRSNLKGKGIQEAIAGVEAQFVVSTGNSESLYHEILDSVTVEITNDHDHDCATEVRIWDNKDGTYKISYLVQEVGKYNAFVKLNGENVPGSPFALYVKSQEMKGEKDGTSGIRNSVQQDGISYSATVKLNKEDAPGSSSSGEVRSTGKKAAPLLGGPAKGLSVDDTSTDQLLITPDTECVGIVTSKGGTLIADGVHLTCPSGAVDSPVTIKMTLEDPMKYYGVITQKGLQNSVIFGAPVVRLQPNGQRFNKPVVLSTKLRNSKVMHSSGSFLILHGTQAPNRKVTWKDITYNSKYDSENEEIEIEIVGFSLVTIFLRLTCQVLPSIIVSRLNFISFNYTLSVLFKDSYPHSPFGVLALVFVSQDIYHQLAHRENDSSALVQLKNEQFEQLCATGGEESNMVHVNESLKIFTLLGDDHKLVDREQQSINVVVEPHVWWTTGHVEKIPLQGVGKVRILCGKVCVRGQYGNTREDHFCERDLRGYVRRLLRVEGTTLNHLPLARKLGMTEEQCQQVVLCWKSEDEQLEEILQHWKNEQGSQGDPASLREQLKDLRFEDYRVKERGEMHINHLRDLAKVILSLEHGNPQCIDHLAREIHILSKDVLRDCCIEVAGADERVSTPSSTEDYVHFLEMHRKISKDEAQIYLEMISSSKETKFENFLSCLHALIQTVKEIFCAEVIPDVQTGLRGLPKEVIDRLASNFCIALQNEDILKLISELCETLKKLCLNNSTNQSTEEIEMWASGNAILALLYLLKRFFQSKDEVRLYKRLQVISGSVAGIMSNLCAVDRIVILDFNNTALSLLDFAKFDPNKLVKFELLDSTGFSFVPFSSLQYTNPPHDTFHQIFQFRKECEDELILDAIAHVHINGRIHNVGAFQAVIMLPAIHEDAFNRSPINTLPVAVQKRHRDPENVEVVLYAMQSAHVKEALVCLENELGEVIQWYKTQITQSPLKVRSCVEAGTVVRLSLVYKWQSESIALESRHFDALADSRLGGAQASSLQMAVSSGATGPLSMEAELASLVNSLSLVPMDPSTVEFERTQKHAQKQCGRFEVHYHQTNLKGHICMLGDGSTVRVQSPSPETRFPDLGFGSSPEAITEGSNSGDSEDEH